MPDTFSILWIVVTVIVAGSAMLLAFMFWNASLTSNPFTRTFLRLLSLSFTLYALEIISAIYRTMQITSGCIPVEGNAVALLGRAGEIAGNVIIAIFLLRPSTKKALNGVSP